MSTERRIMPWEMTLQDFLGPNVVYLDGALSAFRHNAIAQSEAKIRAAKASRYDRVDWSYRPDLVLLIERKGSVRGMLVEDAETGERLAGVHCGLPVVFSEHRGRGIGAEIVARATAGPDLILKPTSYSESGFGARLGAHRLLVERALAEHLDVPAKVSEAYEATPDGLRLKAPWTIAEQNALALDWAAAQPFGMPRRSAPAQPVVVTEAVRGRVDQLFALADGVAKKYDEARMGGDDPMPIFDVRYDETVVIEKAAQVEAETAAEAAEKARAGDTIFGSERDLRTREVTDRAVTEAPRQLPEEPAVEPDEGFEP